ncbi:MAG: hypothetical protein AABZ60_17080, partial [Planctomycetota bacterium]
MMIGCSSAPVESNSEHTYYSEGPTPADKQKLWDAMVAVLGRYFVIRESIFREGVIVATSRVTHHGSQKTRAKVTGKIIQDEEGYFQPMVRVNEQIDISSPRPMNPTGSQPQYEWIRVRNNSNLEAKLVNEINVLAYGRKGFSSEFFLGPVKSHPIEAYPRKTPSIQEEEPEHIYEIERVRERVIEERIEIDGRDSSHRNPSTKTTTPKIRINDVPVEESTETEEVTDPNIETQSSNAEESKTFSKDKEKSTLSK